MLGGGHLTGIRIHSTRLTSVRACNPAFRFLIAGRRDAYRSISTEQESAFRCEALLQLFEPGLLSQVFTAFDVFEIQLLTDFFAFLLFKM